MPTERLFKYSIAGSALLTSLLFFYLFFGGDIETINHFFTGGEHLFRIGALILTTPALGIMVSIIGFEALVVRYGYKVYYYVPENTTLIEWMLQGKETTSDWEKDLRQRLAKGDTKSNEFRRKFYPFYQVKVRKHIKAQSLSFLERKWSVIWVHRNIVTAVIISFLLMLSYLCVNYQNLDLAFNFYKFAGLVFIGFYFYFAYRHVTYAILVATENEHKLLMNAMEDEKKKLAEALPTKKETATSLVGYFLEKLFGITNRT